MKMLCKKIALIITISFLNSAMLFGEEQKPAEDVSQPKDVPGWGAWALDKAACGGAFLKEKKEITNLIEALMHIPYVLYVDSPDPQAIKISTMLAGAATGLKLVNILGIPKNIPPALIFIWDGPKVIGLVGAGLYDVIRIGDAEKIAEHNKLEAGKLKSFKITQSIQLTIEIILRMLALISKHGIGQDNGYSSAITIFATELADVVSIWRLLGRYTTYFMYLDEFAINWEVVVKKKDSEKPAHALTLIDGVNEGGNTNEVSEKTDVVGAGLASLPPVEKTDQPEVKQEHVAPQEQIISDVHTQ